MDVKGPIAVVDCDNVRRDGLLSRLTLLGYHVAVIADHADNYIKATRECPVRLAVVNVGTTDETLPPVHGLETVAYIHHHQPGVPVLALFQSPDAQLPLRAFKAGAASVEDFEHLHAERLRRLVAALLRGDRYPNTYYQQRITARPVAPAKPVPTCKERLETLTDAEKKVLDLVLQHRWLSNAEIGNHLDIEVCTVKTHLRNVCKTLGCGTRKDLVPLAAREGWLPGIAQPAAQHGHLAHR